LGVSQERSDFSADGTEAFAPYSNSRNEAFFLHEELRLPWGTVSLGARWEQASVTSQGHPSIARFTPGSRSFQPHSQALGVVWNAAPAWTLSANLARSERAPKDYELFADGPHVATNAYEVGLPTAQVEQSRQFDLGLQWKRGAHAFGVSAFVNEFANYLLLDATGTQRDSDGNGGNGVSVSDSGNGDNTSAESGGAANILPEFAYSQVPARFAGWELRGRTRLLEGASILDLDWKADLVRATNTATGQALPRIAPMRLGAGLAWAQGPSQVRLDVQHVSAQNDVPAGQTATGAYTLVNLSAAHRQKWGKNEVLWHARIDNLTDQLAYSATSILTQTAPGKAPLPGRSLKLGMRLSF
jgi:iron complex outermembrane receptor protein